MNHDQLSFSNSGKGWEGGGESKSPPACGGIGNFTGREPFYQVKGTWGWVILMIQTFFKAKNSFL